MSKEDVASGLGPERDRDTETDGSRTVDLGLGIEVDIDLEAVDTVETEGEDGVELAFDEREVIEAAGTGPTVDRTDPDERTRLEDDERERLEAAEIDPEGVREKAYSYRMLLDAGLEESIADALRRRFSLPWSFDGEGDLDRRSSEVRGLGEAEREWIAISDDETWQAFEYDESPLSAVGREKPAERPWPKPTPVTAVAGVGPDDADALAEAGIRSAERLATVSAFSVARVLDLDVLHVRTWRHNARELLE